ncbi:hypothetical protein B0T16DRAFT_410540 [Cercophora newfieldiana]|uniref:Uncharacterized protein n=1 Tax=Cercophora newfieldiana TaxID=92897 RepID=A0AA40CSJ2_9PEZI|nr:hypothetical protein B0T16DRAFT_410540 [Cercophora newfieldiana]
MESKSTAFKSADAVIERAVKRGPDLNPIENVWHILKGRIMEQYPHLTSLPNNDTAKEELVRAAICVWEEIGEEVLHKLLLSMQRRLEAVIEADGWYTKY